MVAISDFYYQFTIRSFLNNFTKGARQSTLTACVSHSHGGCFWAWAIRLSDAGLRNACSRAPLVLSGCVRSASRFRHPWTLARWSLYRAVAFWTIDLYSCIGCMLKGSAGELIPRDNKTRLLITSSDSATSRRKPCWLEWQSSLVAAFLAVRLLATRHHSIRQLWRASAIHNHITAFGNWIQSILNRRCRWRITSL